MTLKTKIILATFLIFMYTPLFIIVFYSFTTSKTIGNFSAFSLGSYTDLIENSQILKALYFTLLISIISTIISTILGVITSLGIYYTDKRSYLLKYVTYANYLPIINPDIVIGITIMILFISISFTFGITTILMGHILFSTPFVIVSILPKLYTINPNEIKASYD